MRFIVAHVAPLILLLFAMTPHVRSADESQSEDIAAIRAAAQSYLDALHRGDAKALTAAWTSDGDYVSESGHRIKAHDLIQQEFPAAAAAANTDRPKITAAESTVRLISPEVAIEDGSSAVDAPASGAANSGRFTAVWVKRDGHWLLEPPCERALTLVGHFRDCPTSAPMRHNWLN